MKAIPHYALLSCDVFDEELKQLGGDRPPWARAATLEMGLHDHPENLRLKVSEAIAQLEADPKIEAIALAYGRCGNGLIGVRGGRCPLIIPQAHDCVSILLGGTAAHSAFLKEQPGTYFYTPGWVRGKRVPGPDREAHLRELFAQRYADDPEMIDELVEVDRETFEHHNCAAYVDITGNAAARIYCQNCAEHLGWQHRQLPGDASFLRKLIEARWDQPRFLRVMPGQVIQADTEGRLIATNTEYPDAATD